MSTLNGSVLNGEAFEAGTGTSKFLEPVGTVLVDGSLTLTLKRLMTTSQTAAAVGDASLGRKLVLVAQTPVALINGVQTFETTWKTARLETIAQCVVPTIVGRYRGLKATVTASATSGAQSGSRIVLKSAKSLRCVGVVGGGRSLYVVSSRNCTAIPYAIAARRRTLSSTTVNSAIGAEGIGRKLYLRATRSCRADSTAPHSALNTLRTLVSNSIDSAAPLHVVKTLAASAQAFVVAEVVIGKFILASANEDCSAGSDVRMAKGAGIYGVVTVRAYSDVQMDERDTKRAPEERQMIVPFEDRKMMVA